MSMQDLNKNKQNQTRFEELMGQVNREGKEELLKYIKEETDFSCINLGENVVEKK